MQPEEAPTEAKATYLVVHAHGQDRQVVRHRRAVVEVRCRSEDVVSREVSTVRKKWSEVFPDSSVEFKVSLQA